MTGGLGERFFRIEAKGDDGLAVVEGNAGDPFEVITRCEVNRQSTPGTRKSKSLGSFATSAAPP